MELVSRAFGITRMSGREWERNHSCADSTFQRWWAMPAITHRDGRWVRDLRPHSAPAMQRWLKKNQVEHIAQESLSELWDVGYVPLFFGKVITLIHGYEKGRHILFWKKGLFSLLFIFYFLFPVYLFVSSVQGKSCNVAWWTCHTFK